MCFRALMGRLLVPGVLLCAGMAAADVLDGGEVRFAGRVTDEGPRWTWQLGASDQTWAVDTAGARTVANRLVFDLHARGALPFLEGRLHQVADQGGPGFSPQVTFSSQGQSLLLPQGGDTTRGRFQAAVPVTDPDTGRPVGQLAFTVEQGLAAAFGVQPATGGAGMAPGLPAG
ncbi:fimbrial protein, partial [Salmonella enterica]|nr:fimbrial protein [Salmonella enterica]EDZ7746805.1 fimbrial protein [Salmonella enterica]